jgi:probable O-glycosylation ligase (exosortase A-associated)
MALSVVAILGTHSRGALIGLAAMLLFLLLKSRKRLIFVPVMALTVYLSLQIMPRQWFERMETIQSYEQDASAGGRINAWWFAFNLAKDRPLVGGGFETFRASAFKIYAPDPEDVHDAHSIYFEVLGEHGFVGFVFFTALGLSVWRSCTFLRKTTITDPEIAMYGDLARMTQVSLVGYAAAGAFLGLAYFDLYYNLVAAVVLAKSIVTESLRENDSRNSDAWVAVNDDMELS